VSTSTTEMQALAGVTRHGTQLPDALTSSLPATNGRRLLLGAGVLALVLLLAGLAHLLHGLLADGGKTARKPPKLTLMTPPAPPPPPPPPPKFEKKPDPPQAQKEIKLETPQPKPEPTPASPELKMDGPAGDGPSAFGAGKITSEDLSKLGTGKTTGAGGTAIDKNALFNPFSNYANLLKGELQRQLNRNAALKRLRYSIELALWLGPSGAATQVELVGSTGDRETDELIRQAITALPAFSQAPPAQMPQPIRLRLVTRD